MERYIGVTIGPIYDTIRLTSKPAGMWAGSYLFSYLSRMICENLVKQKGIKENAFVCPYFEWDTENNQIRRPEYGVGLFPDRIIFRSEESVKEYSDFFTRIKEEIGKQMEEDGSDIKECCTFMKEYIQIYAVEREIAKGKNPILELSPYLDCYELQRSFAQNKGKNPVIELFSKEGKSNWNVKKSFLVKDCENIEKVLKWDLLVGDKIKNIENIANPRGKVDLKKEKYYVVAQADGDSMGIVLESLKTLDQIRDFSKTLLGYAVNAVTKIRAYGGVPIYAGGDDLLFLASMADSSGGRTIFRLIEEISERFKVDFQEFLDRNLSKSEQRSLIKGPTLSWGLEINYYKFPLYEAFNKAGGLLFQRAKKTQYKNTVAVECSKRSGKSFTLEFEQFSSSCQTYQMVLELSQLFLEFGEKDSGDLMVLQSVAQKIWEFRSLFSRVESKEHIANLFNNLFDSEVHAEEKIKTYIFRVRTLYQTVWETDPENCADTVNAVLRMMKLYIETGED